MTSSHPTPLSQSPTPGQLEVLQRLCAETGQRYSKPRTRKQARGRIRDLEIRARHGRRKLAPPPKAKPPAPAPWSALPRLLADLKRAHYTYAKCLEKGRPADGHLRRATDLEADIDRLMESA